MQKASSLQVPAHVKQLAAIREFVEDYALSYAVDQAAVYDLVLAVNEMATNIIVHGYRGEPGEIAIDLRREGDAIEIVLRDTAPPFDPTSVPTPDITRPLHQRPLGGMGVHVTRQMMDAMRHRALPEGGNELTLIKRGIIPSSQEE